MEGDCGPINSYLTLSALCAESEAWAAYVQPLALTEEGLLCFKPQMTLESQTLSQSGSVLSHSSESLQRPLNGFLYHLMVFRKSVSVGLTPSSSCLLTVSHLSPGILAVTCSKPLLLLYCPE